MTDKKPLVIAADGSTQQIQPGDTILQDVLPSQLSDERILIRKILFELTNQGIQFQDEDLLNEIKQGV